MRVLGPSVRRFTRGDRAYCRPRRRGSVEYRASQCRAGAGYRAGVGWRRFGRPLRGYGRPKNSRSYSPMERPVGAAELGTRQLLWRLGSLWWAWGPDLLGLRFR
jgi:hypothetical protein